MRKALALSNVDAFYGDSHVLHRISFELGEGRLLGLLGRNGAGKTTCMNVTVGLLAARGGTVEIFGESFVRTYRAIKETEYETFMGVISAWEREYLLLSV